MAGTQTGLHRMKNLQCEQNEKKSRKIVREWEIKWNGRKEEIMDEKG